MTRLAKLYHYSGFVKVWILPVWLGLGLARLTTLTVEFRRLAPRLGRSVGVAPWVPVLDEREENRARLIGQVIRLAARHTPWESNCFPQAIVARVLMGLYRLPYCLFFGVRRNADSGDFDAHAWVAAGRVRIIGGWSFDRYTVVGVFVSPGLAKRCAQP